MSYYEKPWSFVYVIRISLTFDKCLYTFWGAWTIPYTYILNYTFEILWGHILSGDWNMQHRICITKRGYNA